MLACARAYENGGLGKRDRKQLNNGIVKTLIEGDELVKGLFFRSEVYDTKGLTDF